MLEVILQSVENSGMLLIFHALQNFDRIMAEDGRLSEIGNPEPHEV